MKSNSFKAAAESMVGYLMRAVIAFGSSPAYDFKQQAAVLLPQARL